MGKGKTVSSIKYVDVLDIKFIDLIEGIKKQLLRYEDSGNIKEIKSLYHAMFKKLQEYNLQNGINEEHLSYYKFLLSHSEELKELNYQFKFYFYLY